MRLSGIAVVGMVWFAGCATEPDASVETSNGVEGRRIASMRGVVENAVGDETLIVDIVYAVEAGEDVTEVGERELAAIEPRAVPWGRYRYVLNSITWDNLPVDVYYNGTGVDSSVAADDHAGTYQDSLQVWNDVTTSDFAFNYAGATTRCPSLVKECGPQTFDGFNDVVWIALAGSASTLAITWTGTSIDEADQAYNTNNTWSIGDVNTADIDFLTVAMHENGHSLGLGHSTVSGATMEAYYSAADWTLHQDDIDGVAAKYPSGGGGGGGGGVDTGGTCAPAGDSCDAAADCCSNKCTGKPGAKICK